MNVPTKKIGLVFTTIAAATGLVFGGATMANASTGLSASAQAGTSGTSGLSTAVNTSLSAGELAKVNAAVKVKDSSVVVTSVQKNSDGSYLVVGTKANATVKYLVSADLKTTTQIAAG
ncbi:hypothetical protein [Frankia sp. QA3]|uniref:hypothetical protein n=1 Tax=Frankia sp. QA3 TaxID=710111 RepID=UPI000269BAE7|nr:hypothetical protein [Frankia sp. QA3]EIV91074.1 hypothetical protein FraQA3DRAFT_0503 [Frankia sp. QA3]